MRKKLEKWLRITRILRFLFLTLCFLICYSGVSGTLSFSSDIEKSVGNKFQAGEWESESSKPATNSDRFLKDCLDESRDDDNNVDAISIPDNFQNQSTENN